MTRVSLNQINSEIVKAITGINLEWGLAYETAKMCVFLSQHNIKYSREICYLLNKYKDIKYTPNLTCKEKESIFIAPFFAFSLLENIISNKCQWEGYVFAPQFLIAAIGMFAKEFNIKFSIKNKKNILIAKSNDSKVCVLKRNLNSDYYFISQEKTNIPQNNLSPLKKVNKYKIDDNDWSTILSFGKNSFVKDSISSKEKGAGY